MDPSEPRKGPPVVLVVDDEPDMLHLLSAFLSSELAPVRVLIAPTASHALEIVGREHVDVMVTDYRLPDFDGVELLKRIRRHWKGRGTIMMTAYADSNLEVQARVDGGADYFFSKPLEPMELASAVRTLLDGGRKVGR